MTDEKDKPVINKGLAGIYADESKISRVMPETNSLTYRGYAVQDLVANCSFEETAYLIWNGELPDAQQLASFKKKERSLRELDPCLSRVLAEIPPAAHPMDVLRTAVSYIGTQDILWDDMEPEESRKKSLNLMAKIPTVIAATIRRRYGLDSVEPRDDLGFSENFFHMVFETVPEPEIIKAFDATMILYAEHGFNASTFTARTIASTQSDMYSAITGAIGALKGSLHGGANEAVMRMMEDIGLPERAEDWLMDALSRKKTIMGFGHAVYKNGDSRVPTLNALFNDVARLRNGQKWVEMAQTLEDVMYREKKLKPNVDFPTGPLYHMMGFDTEMFTPFFVMARITGWTAHVMEQRENNKLIRPLSSYNGPAQRPVPPISQRNGKGPAPAAPAP